LSVAAPAGGSTVTLASNNTSVTVPASASVAAGATTGTFTASVGTVSTNQSATLTASLNGSSQTFVVNVAAPAPTISSLSCNPSSVAAPGSTNCTIGLSVAAPGGGSVVTLASNNANVTVPANATVAAGATTGAFTATVASV